jgi:hypothetical protein
MKIVKIYGLRRTGTNYLQWLLANNFRQLVVLTDSMNWKHGLPTELTKKVVSRLSGSLTNKDYTLSTDLNELSNLDLSEDSMAHILCVKDPYSWYQSICKWNGIDPFPLTNNKLEQLFLWNYMGEKYIEFKEKYYPRPRTLVVKYEDMLSKPHRMLYGFAYVLGLDLISNPMRPTQFVDNVNNVYDGTSFVKRRHFYATKKYLTLYFEKDFAMMRKFLDKKVIKRLGYKLR